MSTTHKTFAANIARRIAAEGVVTLPYRSDSAVIRALVESGLSIHSEVLDGLQAYTRVCA